MQSFGPIGALLLAPLALIACSSSSIVAGLPLVRVRPPGSERIPASLLEKGTGDPCAVWIVMRDQIDLDRLGADLRKRGLDKQRTREEVIAALRALARAREADLDRSLRGESGVWRLEGLTVVNGIALWAKAGVVRTVAERGDVAYVIEDSIDPRLLRRSGKAREMKTAVRSSQERVAEPVAGGVDAWWLEVMGVPKAWEMGYSGEGVVVGFLDSGASATHEQTRDGYRGGEDSWYDPSGEYDEPIETYILSHSTSLVSLAVGRGGSGMPKGVAPGAEWVAALGLRKGWFRLFDIVLSADWMLTRGRPDVLVCAWAVPHWKCNRSLDRVLSALKAAGIFVVFSAGNEGPGPGTNRFPANAVGIFPGDGVAFSVGGTIKGGDHFPESSEGPNLCDGTVVFPRVSAPAADLIGAHALGSNLYLRHRGTSYAAALVAGAAALLIQSEPELRPEEIEERLMRSADDLGARGPDPIFGYGLVRIDRAIEGN